MYVGSHVLLCYIFTAALFLYSRIQGEDSLIKMTRSAYSHFVHGYFEKDRLLFSLFLALEVHSVQFNIY